MGLEAPEHLGRFEKRFLASVDISKGPIERTVTHMIRLRAPDYLGQEKNKTKLAERREFLYFVERWTGVNFMGVPVSPVEHTMGVYQKQFLKPHINQKTGEIDYEQLDAGKAQTVHYIPFSKKAVDDIISKSVHSDKDTGIIYTIKFASEDCVFAAGAMPTRCQFTYDQFANWKWEDIYRLHTKPTVQAAWEYQNKDKSAYNLQFEPT